MLKKKRFWDVILYTIFFSIMPGLIIAWHFHTWNGIMITGIVWAILYKAVYELERKITRYDQ